MHIDWKCPKCGKKHLTTINDINDINKTTIITLTCSTCNTSFAYRLLYIKYLVNCLVCDSSNNTVIKQTISLWD